MKKYNLVTCLWFNDNAEEAARFYTSLFPASEITGISYYNKEGHEHHGHESGSVMSVSFTVRGQEFLGLNGGPLFSFNEAVSFQVFCETQEEIDKYWSKLTEGGSEVQCGWLKDKFGVSWQIIPAILSELLSDPQKSERVTREFMKMKKLDIAKLINA
jgi:predicted 3-demethylubiquinone-9 3-methyltransferase (glyoxalase superfamily)